MEGRSVRSELRNAARSMPRSSQYPESPLRRQRRRRTHKRVDSYGEVAGRRRRDDSETTQTSPSKSRPKNVERNSIRVVDEPKNAVNSTEAAPRALEDLDRHDQKHGWNAYHSVPRETAQHEQTSSSEYFEAESDPTRLHRNSEADPRRHRNTNREAWRKEAGRPSPQMAEILGINDGCSPQEARRYPDYRRNGRRSTSGRALENGPEYYREKDKWRESNRTSRSSKDPKSEEYERQRKRKRRRNICIAVIVFLLLLVIIVPVAVVFSKRRSSNGKDGGPSNNNLHNISPSDIPKWAKGGYLDPFDWYDTTDFNVTFTNEKVGGLYVMGLYSEWDDSTRANENVPPLNKSFDYGSTPFRGVNVGGWLSIEPFITPSFFESYDLSEGIVDEWTLSEHLGPDEAKSALEKHYSQWIQESDFADIQAAGFDHVRIPFSYWAVTTYQGDPYVPMISWRYLLRGIEWARKYGLRINLDIHGLPGSQNGWNHSGRQGPLGWLNGTDGDLNGDRSIEIHKQLAEFFSQPRYKNIITMYGLVNEPKMTVLPVDKVLDWSRNVIDAVRGKGYKGLLIMGDGFLGLQNWQGKMQGIDGLVLDGHQYTIFDTGLLAQTHHEKIGFACGGWTVQAQNSLHTSTGFGPTIFGEWSQADTDCTKYLSGIGVGTRWEGTLNEANTPGGATDGTVLTPSCPTDDKSKCSCEKANADPSSYSDEYKKWLLTFAEAQMHSFEIGWGWFYWTWKTEKATQWSYKDGLAVGVLPKVAYKRSWDCNMDIPDFAAAGLPEYY